ncbi:hypothetical protein [Kamptonema formosum]|uniref:hypothetical protein n=1 Tax=Kamptonema formosum TaxID=331992 RepID=UPI00036E8398|nr:hypothetical protein [Oscillatoria sp. PCC 10802]
MNKQNETKLIGDMIVLGVHMSGVIGCDAETRRISRSAVGQYFATGQARRAIRSCIEKAKDNPLRLSQNKHIQVQVTPRIGRAIQTGEMESVLGLKEFLEEISEETDTVTVIGRSASEDEVLLIRGTGEGGKSRVLE